LAPSASASEEADLDEGRLQLPDLPAGRGLRDAGEVRRRPASSARHLLQRVLDAPAIGDVARRAFEARLAVRDDDPQVQADPDRRLPASAAAARNRCRQPARAGGNRTRASSAHPLDSERLASDGSPARW
jgi:hypothetical protein